MINNTAYDLLGWLRAQAIADASFDPPMTGEARLGPVRVQYYPASGTTGWFFNGIGKASRRVCANWLALQLGLEAGMG